MRRSRWLVPSALSLTVLVGALLFGESTDITPQEPPPDLSTIPLVFLAAMGGHDAMDVDQAIDLLDQFWDPSYLPYFIEAYRFGDRRLSRQKLRRLLESHTEPGVGSDLDTVSRFVWSQPIENSPAYAFFKQIMHRGIDPAFERYFEPDRRFDIRLDEISWGGVVQDGIPPLRDPTMIAAKDATYLRDSHVVFGIEIDGETRAYPKRILAWHEMFVDHIAGVGLAGVYCTLCGTVIIYETEYDGVAYDLGTSGFLYRSNKLMYDQATQSLWSTMEGTPVVGPLAGKGIRLETRSVVTTTWGEWKKRHPDTLVLSLDTGHQRDYGEGVAYRDYFATDQLMFETPFNDTRLPNKAEVLALRYLDPTQTPVAISTDFLRQHPIYESSIGGQSVVVLTDQSGASRVYLRPTESSVVEWDQSTKVIDSEGRTWRLTESALVGEDGQRLERLTAHRAFWFGWHSAFPETVLIQ